MINTPPAKNEKKLDILLVGQVHRDEFADAIVFLCRLGEVHLTPRLEEAVQQVRQGSVLPQLVVLLQSRPGEFLDKKVHQLRAAAPLARLVTLLGSWCEGEMRTGVPLQGMVRLYWHEWEPVCDRELVRLIEEKNASKPATTTVSTWAMPVTASDEERLLANRQVHLPPGSGLVAIDSASSAMASWIADACEQQGYSVFLSGCHREKTANLRGVDVVIVDASEGNRAERARIEELQARWLSARMMVLLDFPRICQRRDLQRRGVTTIVSKPITLEALLWHVGQLASINT